MCNSNISRYGVPGLSIYIYNGLIHKRIPAKIEWYRKVLYFENFPHILNIEHIDLFNTQRWVKYTTEPTINKLIYDVISYFLHLNIMKRQENGQKKKVYFVVEYCWMHIGTYIYVFLDVKDINTSVCLEFTLPDAMLVSSCTIIEFLLTWNNNWVIFCGYR